MSIVCKQLRCLMFRSEQIGIPLHSRGPDPKPAEVGRKTCQLQRALHQALHSHLCCASLIMVLFQLSFFLVWVVFVFFFSLYGAVYNLNILCTYPTQWVEQTNIQNQIDVVNTVR